MLEFAPNTEISRVSTLAHEFFEQILYDEEPLFVSDEATLWSIATASVDEVLERCRNYYGVTLSFEETQELPLWKLLRVLDKRRKNARHRMV